MLAGPGRWGSKDRWLGIPVEWQDISGVRAMVEIRTEKLQAEPSQGTHFFQNITSMGIHYITVTEGQDRFDWQWLLIGLVFLWAFRHHISPSDSNGARDKSN